MYDMMEKYNDLMQTSENDVNAGLKAREAFYLAETKQLGVDLVRAAANRAYNLFMVDAAEGDVYGGPCAIHIAHAANMGEEKVKNAIMVHYGALMGDNDVCSGPMDCYYAKDAFNLAKAHLDEELAISAANKAYGGFMARAQEGRTECGEYAVEIARVANMGEEKINDAIIAHYNALMNNDVSDTFGGLYSAHAFELAHQEQLGKSYADMAVSCAIDFMVDKTREGKDIGKEASSLARTYREMGHNITTQSIKNRVAAKIETEGLIEAGQDLAGSYVKSLEEAGVLH